MLSLAWAASPRDWVEYAPEKGPGAGKHVVLIAGDEEYRSEESMPMLGRILARHHGFRCTVLFSVDEKGFVQPNAQESLTNPQALDSADVIVMLVRFRKWPDEVMARFDAAMKRGVPVVALRTSTHAFKLSGGSAFASYNQFGKEVLGEKWVSHWGVHKKEATRGVVEAGHAGHPILRGVSNVFGNSDVYEAAPPEDAVVLMRGEVLVGMNEGDPSASYRKKTAAWVERGVNDPMMPVAWVREISRPGGAKQRVFTCTMGAATDLASDGLRRMVVNAVYWAGGLEPPDKADVSLVGEYQALMYGFNGFRKGVTPADFES